MSLWAVPGLGQNQRGGPEGGRCLLGRHEAVPDTWKKAAFIWDLVARNGHTPNGVV